MAIASVELGFEEIVDLMGQTVGLTAPLQHRIGVVVVLSSMIEHRVERLLLTLRGEDIKGRRPSTDCMQITDLLREITSEAKGLPGDCAAVIDELCVVLGEFFGYRNAIVHGFPLPSGGGAATITSNANWHGETRKRPVNQAHVDARLLEMMINGAVNLYDVAAICATYAADQNTITTALLIDHGQRIKRARSSISEVVHIAALMNCEKY